MGKDCVFYPPPRMAAPAGGTILPMVSNEKSLRAASFRLAEACLHAMDIGVVLVSSAGDILFMNALAAQIVSPAGYTHPRGSLSHIDEILSPGLRQTLKGLIVRSPRGTATGQYTDALCNVDITVSKASRAGYVVFLRSGQYGRLDDFKPRVRKLYKLTPQEARIACELAQGQTVSNIASRLGVQKNTIRVHLKHIYYKTGTRCQSQLVSRLICDSLRMGRP